MTNEEFQKLVLEKLGGIEQRLDNIESNMVTKEYLDKVLLEQQNDVKALLQHISNKLDD